MEWEIRNKQLLMLYETGSSRKYRLQKQVVNKFFMRIQQIEAAHTIHDLWKTPALNFEYLEEKKFYSIRVDREYRLEIEIHWLNNDKTVGKFIIKNLSKHYGD